MTKSMLTHHEKIYAKGLTKKEYNKKYRLENKEKLAKYIIEYRHSREGLAATMYNDQRRSSKHRKHPEPDYSLNELRAWLFSRKNFEEIYQDWVKSDFNMMKAPSCDRLDDYKPYTFENLRLTNWEENKARSHADMKAGINTKTCRAVIQLTKDGNFIARHHSTISASRATGVRQGHISEYCSGKRKTAGGFVWRYA